MKNLIKPRGSSQDANNNSPKQSNDAFIYKISRAERKMHKKIRKVEKAITKL
jgi:hypothetical protein